MIRASVVIPAYNAAAVIERSVASALEQTEPRIEILVVDDCSTDGTAAIVQRLAERDARLRLLRTPRNGGPGLARNIAMQEARGEWLALLDADDRYHPQRLEHLLRLGESSGADMVADNMWLCPAGDATARAPMLPPSWLATVETLDAVRFVRGNMPGNSRARIGFGYLKPVLRRAFVQASGLRYDAARFAEDYLFGLRCLLAGARWVLTPEPLYDYTVAERSLTTGHSEADLIFLQDQERALLTHPAVVAQPALAAMMRRHLRSVERASAWFQFARAVKRRDPLRALAGTHGNPMLLAHIGRQGLRALPSAVRKLASRPRH
jgi:glycosyltransferase involved in cell wall biosynthesis